MDPLQDLRWAQRADRSGRRGLAVRFLLLAAAAIILVVIANVTEEMGPSLWRMAAFYIQRAGIGFALMFGALGIVYALESRASSLGPRRDWAPLVIVLLVVVLATVATFLAL